MVVCIPTAHGALKASTSINPERCDALDEGAMVIAAHACSYGLILYEKFLPDFRELVHRCFRMLLRPRRPLSAR